MEEENRRKARRDKKRVPKLDKKDFPPINNIPLAKDGEHWWKMVGRDRQIGREVCIKENKHDLVKSNATHWIGNKKIISHIVWCNRCGEFGGFAREQTPD